MEHIISQHITTFKKGFLSPNRTLYDKIVYVDIGPEKREFGVHKGLICFYSKFFKAAFNGHFHEGSTGRVFLPDDDPDVFELIYMWLYTLSMTQAKNGYDMECSPDQKYRVWLFGDKYEMIEICNRVMDSLLPPFDRVIPLPTLQQVEYIYAGTPKHSPMRTYITTKIFGSKEILHEFLTKEGDNLTSIPEFLLDLMQALADFQMENAKTSWGFSLYARRHEFYLVSQKQRGESTSKNSASKTTQEAGAGSATP